MPSTTRVLLSGVFALADYRWAFDRLREETLGDEYLTRARSFRGQERGFVGGHHKVEACSFS